jgi:CBS domain-containing protein
MKTVESLMTKNPVCCTAVTKLPVVAKMMVDHDCGEIPVVDDMKNLRIMGVITDRDIVCRTVAKNLNPLDILVSDVMTFPLVTVAPGSSLEKCCEIMEEHQIRRLPVVDDFDRICGIISLADIARSNFSQMSEVLREVSHPKGASSIQ